MKPKFKVGDKIAPFGEFSYPRYKKEWLKCYTEGSIKIIEVKKNHIRIRYKYKSEVIRKDFTIEIINKGFILDSKTIRILFGEVHNEKT